MASTNTKSQNVADMQKEIEDLKALVANLIKMNNVEPQKSMEESDILFVSLCNNELNLCTERDGQGDIYSFKEFGEEQLIPYSDAKRIIKSNKKFIDNGLCYIADADFVKSNRINYKNILDKESLEQLIFKKSSDFAKIFDSLTTNQKETVRGIVADRINNDMTVDMNIVQHINEVLNIDILAEVQIYKELYKEA